MPDYVFQILLAINLLGFVFLFLQNRALAQEIGLLREASILASKIVAAPPPPAAAPKESAERLRALETALAELRAGLEQVIGTGQAVSEGLDRLGADAIGRLDALSEALLRPPAPPPEPPERRATLEEAVAAALAGRGCSAVTILGVEESDDEVRARISAREGGMPVNGAVTFRGGVLSDVRITPATRMFP